MRQHNPNDRYPRLVERVPPPETRMLGIAMIVAVLVYFAAIAALIWAFAPAVRAGLV